MRGLLLLASLSLASLPASQGFAQSAVIDLSQPPTGKSRYVLNSDFTPADLGIARREAKIEAAPSAPACGILCQAAAAPGSQEPEPRKQMPERETAVQPRGRTGVLLVAGMRRDAPQAAATAPRKRISFRFGRRR